MIIEALVGALLASTLAMAQNATIFVSPSQVGWPSVFALDDISNSLQLSADASFTWSFSGETDPVCTAGASARTKCTGRVVDHTFTTTGVKTITLAIKDSGKKSVISLVARVDIKQIRDLAVAVRPEIRRISIADWNNVYVKGLYRLKAIGVYDHFGRIHRGNFATGGRMAAHGSPTFLPWHRMQNRLVERALQIATGIETLGVPYWDWIQGYDGIGDYMGNDGRSDNAFRVTDGPFCNDPNTKACAGRWVLPAEYPYDDKALRRTFNLNILSSFQTQQQMDVLMSMDEYDRPPFNSAPTPLSFRSAIEGWLGERNVSVGYNHNGVHKFVGGTMSTTAHSFNDALFLIHHCNVDRLWGVWQAANGCDKGQSGASAPQCYRPYNGDPGMTQDVPGAIQKNGEWVIEGHMLNDVLYPWNLRPLDGLVGSNGYRYLQPDQDAPKLPAPKFIDFMVHDETARKIDKPNDGYISPVKSAAAHVAFASWSAIAVSILFLII